MHHTDHSTVTAIGTITSKGQLTILAAIARVAGWRGPMKVVIEEQGGKIFVTPIAPGPGVSKEPQR